MSRACDVAMLAAFVLVLPIGVAFYTRHAILAGLLALAGLLVAFLLVLLALVVYATITGISLEDA